MSDHYTTVRIIFCLSLLLVSGTSGFNLPGSKQRSNGFSISKTTELSSVSSDRREVMKNAASAVIVATGLGLTSFPSPSDARLEGVNRPELLPSEPGKNVIQVEKFLTPGQAKRMDEKLGKLEATTGFRVRVLCQAYPQTPGLAIRDYWDLGKEGAKDDKFIVLVSMVVVICTNYQVCTLHRLIQDLFVYIAYNITFTGS